MKEEDKKQILALIKTLEEQKASVPFLEDLMNHPVYGGIFADLSDADKKEINELIRTHIVESIASYRTKGGQYFQRFLETSADDFWKFRSLNNSEENVSSEEFQTLGKKIEQEMFRYEGLLTESMLHRPDALDKVVGAFYNIVYRYFPLFGRIE